TSQRIAYYGTLSLSAQNSPTRHLRSISATNPPTHFLSPSHIRAPRRNSSPIAHNVVLTGCNRALSPNMLDLNSYPVQPPYWDAESQQYFYSYDQDSNHASPRRTRKSPSRASAVGGNVALSVSATASPAKRSPLAASALHPMTFTTGGTSTRKMTDYSNLFLPQAPKVKTTLLDSLNSSSSPKEKGDDILRVSQKEDEFLVTLKGDIPTIQTTPSDEEDEPRATLPLDDFLQISQPNLIVSDKSEILSAETTDREEKHVTEVK
ncbi:unnamed protein product, partial [Allacma fusca]